jgi:hypothetical protein
VSTRQFFNLLGASVILFSTIFATALGCDSSGTLAPRSPDDAVCDTTEWISGSAADSCNGIRFTLIECVTTITVHDTIWADPDTVVIIADPDWSCVHACLKLKGLGHWRECLEGCDDD